MLSSLRPRRWLAGTADRAMAGAADMDIYSLCDWADVRLHKGTRIRAGFVASPVEVPACRGRSLCAVGWLRL
jgi:hypothetical protein